MSTMCMDSCRHLRAPENQCTEVLNCIDFQTLEGFLCESPMETNKDLTRKWVVNILAPQWVARISGPEWEVSISVVEWAASIPASQVNISY